jgi:hypothetical protein
LRRVATFETSYRLRRLTGRYALHSDDQKRTAFRYAVSLVQMEYSRNFLFERGRDLERMFQGLIDRTRSTLDINTVKTILGVKQRLRPIRPWSSVASPAPKASRNASWKLSAWSFPTV